MEKQINFFWIAGFFLTAINACIFTRNLLNFPILVTQSEVLDLTYLFTDSIRITPCQNFLRPVILIFVQFCMLVIWQMNPHGADLSRVLPTKKENGINKSYLKIF